ncbi:MAG: hypothetical protein ABR505_03435, partial [Actinomycetota bacterium]
MRKLVVALAVFALVFAAAAPAAADHTDPRSPLSSTQQVPAPLNPIIGGEGTWEYITGFPPNPGSDLKFFKLGGRVFVSSGTLGQGPEQNVGQRMLQLLNEKGEVDIQWVADHGSAACAPNNPQGTTGLQHDAAIAQYRGVTLLIDTTDATGRCHDTGGGGLELVDVSGLHQEDFEPREIHMTRHQGTSHTVTVDATRPWVVYNSSSTFSNTAAAQIDVLDIRSCMVPNQKLEARRIACRPKVFRIQFQPGWTTQLTTEGEPLEGLDSSCHDITARPGKIYCAALSGTVVFDVRNLTHPKTGAVRGTPLSCGLIDGTATTAKVTDCGGAFTPGKGEVIPQARGWKYLGSINHAGRDCGAGPPPAPVNCNSNMKVPSDEEISVAHEAEPTWDGKYVFVTDERGGGLLPPGSSCAPTVPNEYNNGGIHMYDISNPRKIEHALTPDGELAFYRGQVMYPQATGCTSHVMEHVPGEQRFFVSWYSQGTKVVDYFFDEKGRVVFRETASFIPAPNALQWVAQPFKIVKNKDGTLTYHLMASDIGRGIDIFTWTGPP